MFELLTLSMVHWVWVALVAIGVSLLFTALYFRHQSRQLSRALSDLYALNQKVNQDALNFFEQAWSILQSVGCLQMTVNIDWFGERKTMQFGLEGVLVANKRTYNVCREDMRFEIVLFLTREAAESNSLSSLVIKTFLNILEQNLVLKQAEILTSQKRLERYQLFVQHEIKNIAQFIQLLSEQVETIESPEDKIRLVDRLQQTLPVMAKRARKTVDHMQQPLSEFYEGRAHMMNALLSEVVSMYALQARVSGDAATQLPRQLVLEVFKNILGNFRDHAKVDVPIDITVEKDLLEKNLQVTIASRFEGEPVQLPSERLFEPFWTTSDSGMGLGLFLARELLKQSQGDVKFYQEGHEFGFVVELPGLVD